VELGRTKCLGRRGLTEDVEAEPGDEATLLGVDGGQGRIEATSVYRSYLSPPRKTDGIQNRRRQMASMSRRADTELLSGCPMAKVLYTGGT